MDKQFEQNTITLIHNSYLEDSMKNNDRIYLNIVYGLWDKTGQEDYRPEMHKNGVSFLYSIGQKPQISELVTFIAFVNVEKNKKIQLIT